jgi:hypothetical protein
LKIDLKIVLFKKSKNDQTILFFGQI